MLERVVRINNTLGLHARAAAQLVRLAAGFSCRVTIRRNDTGVEANAKSILSVLHIAAGFGISLTIVTDGPDEAAAIEAIERLFLDGFGEL